MAFPAAELPAADAADVVGESFGDPGDARVFLSSTERPLR